MPQVTKGSQNHGCLQIILCICMHEFIHPLIHLLPESFQKIDYLKPIMHFSLIRVGFPYLLECQLTSQLIHAIAQIDIIVLDHTRKVLSLQSSLPTRLQF